MNAGWTMVATVLAAALCGCTGVEPECPEGDRQPIRCGDGVILDEDGTPTAALAAVCDDAWEWRCNDGHGGGRGILPSCSPEGDVSCVSGSPHCVEVPCDGVTRYGPDHPMAGE